MSPRIAVSAVAVVVTLAGAAPAAAIPDRPPPKVSGATVAPPPAWFSIRGREAWFAYSSYCWTARTGQAACVDFLPPARRPELPRARASIGDDLRIQLGFTPTALSASQVGTRGVIRSWKLPRTRIATWRIARLGVIVVNARSSRGSASYAVVLERR